MRLLGQLDSPYVRRVAIGFKLMGISVEHDPLSVFSNIQTLAAINPVLKVPTLECDDGTVLMDSTLILDWARRIFEDDRLLPGDSAAFSLDMRMTGLALAACEKAVQRVYEDRLRPADKQFDGWKERVESQLGGAFKELENLLEARPLPASEDDLTEGAISLAVAWRFCEGMLPALVEQLAGPRVREFSQACEALPVFNAYPFPTS